MKSVRVYRTGPPRVLQLDDVDRPEPGPGEVLVRVHAAGVNPPDWYARSGFSLIPESMRPAVQFPFTPGTDVSGVVVGTGPGVTEWAEGDEVFGLLRFPTTVGAAKGYAEYTTAPVGDLARRPAGIDHVHAAAVPMAGLTAWQYVVDHAAVTPGSTVLVNGAAGGVGHFLVQLARDLGARVIAVASTRHEDFLRGLGADEYIDYTTTDVADAAKGVDHLFDTVGGPLGHRLTPAIRDGGVLSPVFFGDYREEDLARRGIRLLGGQVRSDGRQLAELAGLLDSGAVRVAVDSVHRLAEAWRAHERAEQGHIQGKIVLSVTSG
ncbi:MULTISPECIES: NADP-dependent oxidoreductase [unclassified Frankia]|uniref:NADP-dependent oxidoreductase n=1 Tax=unclassified Frankia TaxID=2632575 RepID=UPI002024F265